VLRVSRWRLTSALSLMAGVIADVGYAPLPPAPGRSALPVVPAIAADVGYYRASWL
jgi:hypothetical protein